MDFSNWNAKDDVLAESLGQPTHWAYSINTQVGQYSLDIQESTVREVIGKDITICFPKRTTNLVLKCGSNTECVMENVTVWPHNYHDKFMVFHSNISGAIYLIDSRGIVFLTDSKTTGTDHGTVKIDRKESCYIINDTTHVYYRSAEARAEFKQKCKGNRDVLFNKDFNRFMRKDAHNTTAYLYLTAGHNKCGAMINYFGTLGMKYELVPNILCDDDTVNVRIPLDEENAARTDVQFLCTKYHNTYSIYGLPLTTIGSGLSLPEKYKRLSFDWGFSSSKASEPMVYSIVDSIRSACSAKDDYDLYKKSFAKIKRLFDRGKKKDISNLFSAIKLKHPYEIISKAYLADKHSYIDRLLELSGESRRFEIISDGCSGDVELNSSSIGAYDYDRSLYRIAYEQSKRMYTTAISDYESSVLAEMASLGIKVSRWKNELHLFSLVHKEYPDAIYQYHTDWLGLQSLDIYIPSLQLGIEYQGEQHYRPIDFFGGEKAFSATVERDKRKANLCSTHNITLLYWKYDEVICKSKLQSKIRNASG